MVLPGLAAAQAPAAVVEDVQGKVTGAEFMDYVAPGQVIKLGQGGSIVLSYMKSCWREVIAGVGTVIVGAEDSMVHLSEVKAGKVKCDLQPFATDQSGSRRKRCDRRPEPDCKGGDVAALYALRPFAHDRRETTGRGEAGR